MRAKRLGDATAQLLKRVNRGVAAVRGHAQRELARASGEALSGFVSPAAFLPLLSSAVILPLMSSYLPQPNGPMPSAVFRRFSQRLFPQRSSYRLCLQRSSYRFSQRVFPQRSFYRSSERCHTKYSAVILPLIGALSQKVFSGHPTAYHSVFMKSAFFP